MGNRKTVWLAATVVVLLLCGLAMGILPGGNALLPLNQAFAQYRIVFPMATATDIYVTPALPQANTTFLPIRVQPEAGEALPDSVDFALDGESTFDTDDEAPFIGHFLNVNVAGAIGDTFTIDADAYVGTRRLGSDDVTIGVTGLPDAEENGIPENTSAENDPFAFDVPGAYVAQVPSAEEESAEVVYTVIGSVGEDTVGVTGELVAYVVTGSDVTVEVPNDAVGDTDGRIIVRTSATPGDIAVGLGALDIPSSTTAFDVAPVVAIDAHLVDSTGAEVSDLGASITFRVPGAFTDELGQVGVVIFYAETDLDTDYGVDVPVGTTAFAQLEVARTVEDNELVFQVDSLTAYVPLYHEGAPIIEAVTGELSGPQAGCTPVTIEAAGYLDSDIVVEFGGNPATDVDVTWNTVELTGTITCMTPAGDVLGPVDVRITNLDVGGGGFDIFAILEDGFEYTLSIPVITDIDPDSGYRGDAFTITGTGFAGDVMVVFGGALVTDAVLTVNCGATATHTIAGTVPATAPIGVVTVVVTNVASDTSDTVTFEVLAPLEGGGRGGAGGPCFIATATYGTSMADQLGVLRTFRDKYLLTNVAGTALMKAYYRYSPAVANVIANSSVLRAITRAALTPVVALLVTPLWMKLALASIALAAVAFIRRRVRA